jgi:hypothetical protein
LRACVCACPARTGLCAGIDPAPSRGRFPRVGLLRTLHSQCQWDERTGKAWGTFGRRRALSLLHSRRGLCRLGAPGGAAVAWRCACRESSPSRPTTFDCAFGASKRLAARPSGCGIKSSAASLCIVRAALRLLHLASKAERRAPSRAASAARRNLSVSLSYARQPCHFRSSRRGDRPMSPFWPRVYLRR